MGAVDGTTRSGKAPQMIWQGDCLKLMQAIRDNSVDSIWLPSKRDIDGFGNVAQNICFPYGMYLDSESRKGGTFLGVCFGRSSLRSIDRAIRIYPWIGMPVSPVNLQYAPIVKQKIDACTKSVSVGITYGHLATIADTESSKFCGNDAFDLGHRLYPSFTNCHHLVMGRDSASLRVSKLSVCGGPDLCFRGFGVPYSLSGISHTGNSLPTTRTKRHIPAFEPLANGLTRNTIGGCNLPDRQSVSVIIADVLRYLCCGGQPRRFSANTITETPRLLVPRRTSDYRRATPSARY